MKFFLKALNLQVRQVSFPGRNVVLFLLFIFIASCHSSSAPDISNIEVDLKVNRFEKDLFSISNSDYHAQIDSLQKKYPVLFPFYFREIGGWNIAEDTGAAWKDSVMEYVQSAYSQALYDSTMMRFSDLTAFEKGLEESFRYYRYYFPEATLPEVATLINAPPAFTAGNDLLCISLDKYLGASSAFYKYEAEPIPYYLLRRFSPEYMVSNCMQVLATGNFEFDPTGKKLLDAMVYNGKVFYLKRQVLPNAPDSIITGFAADDLEWCSNNEPEIWKFFIEHKLLYSPDPLEFSRYVTEGPSTSGMPTEAPGNIGSWVGWKIVAAYMKRNPSLTLQQLMNEDNAQKILTESKYKPTR